MTALIVAIDGPAGSGKSTLARALAERLDLPYLNTGTTYRAVAHRALERGADPDDAAALAALARGIAFGLDRAVTPPSLTVDGALPGEELRTPEVERVVSRIARHPALRAVLHEVQRALGAAGAVVEGRDIGSVVFPDAPVKIYLDAGIGERAARREAELGDPELARAVAERDALDARTNPFVPAPEALVIDSSGLAPEETLEVALRFVRERLGDEGD